MQALADNPRGWYALALSSELAPGELRAGNWFGESLVLWRTHSGQPVLTSAHCPHLGASFAVGGTVEGDTLRCPFHDFRFATDGACVSTPYDGPPPPRAHLACRPIREQDGLILAWTCPDGGPPRFEVPRCDDDTDWTPLRSHRFTARTNVQETAENSVDTGHLAVVHGYRDIRTRVPLTAEGPVLKVGYAMQRNGTSLGLPGTWLDVEFDITICGLGVSRVEVRVPSLPLRTRHWVLPVPVGDGTCELTIAVAAERGPLCGPLLPLRLLGRRLGWDLISRILIRGYRSDVAQDLPIWENKAYVPVPALARGDGPIGRYRAWARQFHA